MRQYKYSILSKSSGTYKVNVIRELQYIVLTFEQHKIHFNERVKSLS